MDIYMTKTPTTWLNTVKAIFKEQGKGTSMKTVLPLAKKEWDLIKSGKHPTKMQAVKGTTAKRSRKKSKKGRKSRKKRKSKKKSRKR
jgi:hypothetical protein